MYYIDKRTRRVNMISNCFASNKYNVVLNILATGNHAYLDVIENVIYAVK